VSIDPAADATTSHRLSLTQRKAILAGVIGNAVEWVDWAVYATFAPVFAAQFFAPGSETTALLSNLGRSRGRLRDASHRRGRARRDRHARKKGLTLAMERTSIHWTYPKSPARNWAKLEQAVIPFEYGVTKSAPVGSPSRVVVVSNFGHRPFGDYMFLLFEAARCRDSTGRRTPRTRRQQPILVVHHVVTNR
jgi:hypothetical protein